MEHRAHVLAQVAATLAVGQRSEHHMTPEEAARLVQNAELLLSAAEKADAARGDDTGEAHRQAMQRFPGHAPTR